MSAAAPGTIRVANVAARLRHLNISCNRCDRRGRLTTLALFDNVGNISILDLLEALSADCPRKQAMRAVQSADPCGIEAPELARLF